MNMQYQIPKRYAGWLLGTPGSPAERADINRAARDPEAARARLTLAVERVPTGRQAGNGRPR